MLFLFWWGEGAMAGRQQTWMWKDLSLGETGTEAGSGPAKPVSNLTPQLFNFLETQLPYLLNKEKNSCLARCLWRWGNILLPPGAEVGGLGACVVGGGAQQRSPYRPFSQSLCTLSCAHPSGLPLLLQPLEVFPSETFPFPFYSLSQRYLIHISVHTSGFNFQLSPNSHLNFRPSGTRIYAVSPLGDISHSIGLNQVQVLSQT